MICPNRNTQEYKDLLEEVGGNEAAADISWFLKYGFEEEAGTLQADQIMAERAEAEMEESWLATSREKEEKLQKVAEKHGMNKKGFFDNTVMPGKVKSDLYDEGLSEEVGVKTTSTQDGSYLYDKSTGRKISPPFSFYSLENEETTEALIDERLEKTLNSFLSSIGVKVEVVDEIRTKHGLSARAVADITNRVVRMAKGQSDIRDLSEEAAHFLIALSRGTDLYNRLVEAVKKTPEYQSVLEDEGYTEAYANNNSALVEEAIAKVLKQILLNTSSTSNRAKVKSLFQEILDFVAGLFGFKEYFNTEASTERSVFEEAANIILNKENPVKTIAPIKSGVSELFESNPELANSVYETLGFNNEKIVETAKGSTYKYLPDGKTQRFKKVEGKEYEPQDILTFVPNYEWIKSNNPQWLEKQGLENDTQYTQYLLKKVQGEGKVWIVDSKGKKIETNQDAKTADRLFITFGKKDGTVEDFIPVSKEPVIGFYTYDSRIHFDEKGERYRDRHLGNKVVKITEGITPQQKATAQQRFQEYVNVTGRQDIEGFKKFVNRSSNKNKPAKEEFFSLSSSDSNVEKYRTAVVLDKSTNTYTFIDSVANKVIKGLQRITSYVKKDQGPELAGAQSDAQYVGTMVHEYVEYAVSQLVNELGGYAAVKPINIPAEHTEIVKNLKKQLTPFITQVIKNGGKIHLELPIANLKKRIAGTLDMLVEWPDGTGHIYDFKTFGWRTEEDLNRGIKQSTIDKTYDPQINEYVQALEQGMPELGIKPIKISKRRIVPIPVYREKDILLAADIDTGLSDDDLNQMFKPVPSERTGDKNLDMVLDRLARHKKILSDKLRATDKENIIKIEELEAKIESVSKQMEDIQLSLQVAGTVEGIFNLLKTIDQDCELGHFDFDLDYQEAMDIINIAEVLTTKLSLQEMRPDETEEEFEEKKENRMKLHGQAGILKTTINEYRDKFLEKTAENTGIADLVKSLGKGLFDANRASGWFRRLFLGISSASHPLVASLKRLIDHAIFKVNQRFKEIHSDIESELDLLYKASGSKSQSVFEPFLQYYNGKRTGNLVAEYKLDFFIKRKEAFRDNDLEWIEDNLELDEEKINEAIAKKVEDYKDEAIAFEVGDIDDYVRKKKESYREYLAKKPSNYKPKNPDTWLDPKYKTIMSTPHLKRFYTFYTEMMQELSKGLPINNRGNFLPSFKQDYLDAISQYGLTNYAKNFFNASVSFGAFQTGQNDPDFGLYDPRTGESIPGIPVPGNNSDISSTEKSYDLGKVLSRFAHGSLTYKHMKEVETAALVTLDYVRDEEFEEVGLITGEPTGKKNKDATTYGYLKDYIDNILYGKKREPGKAFKGKSGKAYSLVKVGDWLLQKIAVKALGVNPFTPATNFIGGNVNLFALASAGKYYGLGDLASAYKEVAANNAKARALVEHFQVLMQDQKFREHLKLSNNSFAQAFTLDKLLIGMEGTDWMMQAANFIAMLKSGKYKFNWDSYDLVDGKLVWKGQGAEPTSQELSGFSAKAKFVAGTMLGNMNDNDRMAAKKWFLGRAVIMFRGWLPQMLHTRFKRKDYDYVTEGFTEGAYITFTREIIGKVLLNAFKLRMDLAGKALKEMTPEDRKNVKMVFTEMALAALLLIAVKLLTGFGDDDEDESMFENYVEVVLSRGFAEATFFMDPTTSSMRQILKDPIVANKAIDDFSGLIVNTWDMTFTDDEHASEKAFKSLLKQFPITATGLNTYERLK